MDIEYLNKLFLFIYFIAFSINMKYIYIVYCINRIKVINVIINDYLFILIYYDIY